jgi:hypothetical protein
VTTKSERIRELGRQGVPVAEIARSMDIRYQHARKVLLDAGLLVSTARAVQRTIDVPKLKPPLSQSHLLQSGFENSARWVGDETDGIALEGDLPRSAGVYAFSIDGVIQYVGVATMGLAKRLYFYRRPAATQATSLRIKAILSQEVLVQPVEILTAIPADLLWNDLPVNGAAGLELGLIQAFSLPWNKRGAT